MPLVTVHSVPVTPFSIITHYHEKVNFFISPQKNKWGLSGNKILLQYID